jgi:hypothetical protein
MVVGVYAGYVDTDATKKLDVPKVSAAEVAEKTMDAIIRNDPEVLVGRGGPAGPFAAVRSPGVDVSRPVSTLVGQLEI